MKNFNIFQRALRKIKSEIIISLQERNPFLIPIFIINFNRLSDMKILINSLQIRGYKNIYIIDNNSTYPPLLEYYKSIENKVKILKQNDNIGHLVFWKKPEIFWKYSLGYYVVTDSDIIPNKDLPIDFLKTFIEKLKKYPNVTKVGFALDLDSIPANYPLLDQVIKWEKKYWINNVEENIFISEIDTTLAIYRPKYLIDNKFLVALRMAGKYTAKHGGWYSIPNKFSEEEKYYFKTANEASSWILNEDGTMNERVSNKMYK